MSWHLLDADSNAATEPSFHYVRFRRGFHGSIEPQRPSEIARPWPRPREFQPLAVHLHRLVGVHDDVAIGVTLTSFLDRHALMPAVHAADGVGLDREREILMHTA